MQRNINIEVIFLIYLIATTIFLIGSFNKKYCITILMHIKGNVLIQRHHQLSTKTWNLSFGDDTRKKLKRNKGELNTKLLTISLK